MTRILKIQALAQRAFSLLGKAAQQSTTARNHRTQFYAAAWREAAGILQAEISRLDGNLFVIHRHDESTRVFLNYTDLDGPVALRIAGNKPLVHRLLQSHQIPTPSFLEFSLSSIDEATKFLGKHGRSVVKPAAGTGGGQGVTTGVTSARVLQQAAVRAAGYHDNLIIEQQICGANIRLLFLDGQLLDAVERRPPMVTGDGHSSVNALVIRLNSERLRHGYSTAQSVLRFDQDMQQTLKSQGLTMRSVPAKGSGVQLKTVINDNMANENDSVVDAVHPTIIAQARTAASAIGLRLAGVDILTPDFSKPLAESGGVVLEVNSTPGFHFHYAQRDSSTRVAIPILAACLNCQLDDQVWRNPETPFEPAASSLAAIH